MEPISLEFKNASESLSKSKRILFSFVLSKRFKFIVISLLGLGVFFLYTAIANGYDFTSTSTVKGEKTVIFHNYNITLAIGIAISLYTLFLIGFYYQTKNGLSLSLIRRIGDYKRNGNTFIYQINDDGITFENHDTRRFYQWKHYSHFKVKSDFILIFSKFWNSQIPIEVIPLESLSKEDVKVLNMSLKSKLPQK